MVIIFILFFHSNAPSLPVVRAHIYTIYIKEDRMVETNNYLFCIVSIFLIVQQKLAEWTKYIFAKKWIISYRSHWYCIHLTQSQSCGPWPGPLNDFTCYSKVKPHIKYPTWYIYTLHITQYIYRERKRELIKFLKPFFIESKPSYSPVFSMFSLSSYFYLFQFK